MTILLMVKTSPKVVGYGILQTIKLDMRSHENKVDFTKRCKTAAEEAKDTWRRYDPAWKFRIVDTTEFDNIGGKYVHQAYFDDIMKRRA